MIKVIEEVQMIKISAEAKMIRVIEEVQMIKISAEAKMIKASAGVQGAKSLCSKGLIVRVGQIQIRAKVKVVVRKKFCRSKRK
jgi:hypothetical protein